jgi:hypothetical protein
MAAGMAIAVLVHQCAPGEWDQPLGWFLAGGMIGLLLFRFWTMTLTSLAGTLLMGYGLLCLLDRLDKLDSVAWAEQRGVLLNGACLGATGLGLLVQYLWDRRRLRKQRWKEELLRHIKEKERESEREYFQRRRGWRSWGGDYRQAG